MSKPIAADFSLVRGDSKHLYVAVSRGGARVNLTGGTVSAQARIATEDALPVFAFTCVIADQGIDPGGALCSISKVDSAAITVDKLVFDIQFDFANGDRTTVAAGTITMIKDVTRA